MRGILLTFIALPLFLLANLVHAQEKAPFKLTDFWAYLELSYRLDQFDRQ